MLRFKVMQAKNKETLPIPSQAQRIVNSAVLFLVVLYVFITLFKEINHLLFIALPTPPSFVSFINELVIGFFVIQTLIMTLVILAFRRSLNAIYPATTKLVNTIIIVWLIKLGTNFLSQINALLYQNIASYEPIYKLVAPRLSSLALYFNLVILFGALYFYFKNKLPYGALWLVLALIQVINFLFNMIFPLFTLPTSELILLYTNFGLMLAKLALILWILIKYYFLASPLPSHN